MRCLYERDPTDRRFLDETIRMIRNNPMSVSELAFSGFWHTELIGEVVAATRYRSSRRSALRLLEEHRGDWEQNAEIVQQLETIEREFAWQSWWRQYGLLTMVLGILAAVTAIFFACQRWWRRGGATK